MTTAFFAVATVFGVLLVVFTVWALCSAADLGDRQEVYEDDQWC